MPSTYESLAVQQAIGAWDTYIKRIDDMFEKLTDQDWSRETSPGRNRGIYLLGHLIAVHDGLIKLFGLGDRQYEKYDKIFLSDPDNREAEYPSIQTLKDEWKKQTEFFKNSFAGMSVDDWFSRHTAVSPEDFEKNPLRNKLNVLLNRTNHLAYHFGQLIYLT